jgi:glycosidase
MDDTSGYQAIDGCFTSNHDIARVVNRIAGGAAGNFDSNGISAQANISDASSYANNLEPAAICTMISELMMPGCTWIYYGDELGLTGNFPNGKSSSSDYADLYYRQPMKWTQGGKVGDGSFQTGYAITGSGMTQALDTFNASSAVASAESQVATEGSVYKTIASFATAKSTLPTLIRGTYKPIVSASDVLQFERVLAGYDTYKVVVNFAGSSTSAGLSGTVVASYNGATLTSLPARSALLIKE